MTEVYNTNAQFNQLVNCRSFIELHETQRFTHRTYIYFYDAQDSGTRQSNVSLKINALSRVHIYIYYTYTYIHTSVLIYIYIARNDRAPCVIYKKRT